MFLNKDDKVLVIIGPSGVGKSTVIEKLVESKRVEITPSWTTRPLRRDETPDQHEHVFTDDETFSAKEKEGYFLETVPLTVAALASLLLNTLN